MSNEPATSSTRSTASNAVPSTPCCALILAGGSGTRFWPVSRRQRPKQLVSLMGDESLLRSTVARLSPLIQSDSVFFCTTQALAGQVREDLVGAVEDESGPTAEGAVPSTGESSVLNGRVLAEPMGRNTAPAIAWSVDVIDRSLPGVDPIVVVLPSDHYVTEPKAFRRALEVAIKEAAANDRIVTLGVPPRWAETGYGYLELESAIDGLAVHQVARFTEKPDREHAEHFVAGGRHLWNAGIFVFRASVFAEKMGEFQPDIATAIEQLRTAGDGAAREIYAQMPNVSIDFGLMEHLEEIAAVPLECGWNDLGSWDALAAVLEKDSAGNFRRGDTMAVESEDNLLFAEEGTIAVVGVSDLVVVRTRDSVLVVPRGATQDVRKVVEDLRRSGRNDLL